MENQAFQDEPSLPPSETRALQKARCGIDESTVAPIGRLFSNGQFLMLCNEYGLVNASGSTTFTLLNQLYLNHFPVNIYDFLISDMF